MKILFCDQISPKAFEALKSSGMFEIDLKEGLDEDDLVETIPLYDAMVVRSPTKVTGRIIEAAGCLKLIVRGGIGLDNIDVEAAGRKGITIANTPDANTESVAELTIGLMFSLARDIPRAHKGLTAGRWEKKQFRGHELGGKTLGIIGMGRIGRSVARKAGALGMNVIGCDPGVSSQDIQETGAMAGNLDELRRDSDYITIHVPITEETRNMIDAEFLAGTKDGVRIINCARGGVIDEEALLSSLGSGKVGGAAMDVFSEEPPGLSALLRHEHVVATPHIGGATREAWERIGQAIVGILTDFKNNNKMSPGGCSSRS